MAFLLQPILSSLLGDFILGIDKNCFKTDLKNNTVGLFDTRLNPKILDNIQFPIKLGYSSLGKMLFKITKKKGQDPNEITLENIYVVFEITDSMKPYDIIEERVNFLAELSKKCMSEINKLKQGPQKPKKDPFEQFKSYFLDNLQVYIRNLHVRVEYPGNKFAGGLTIDEFVINTTDSDGNIICFDKSLPENKDKSMFKSAKLTSLSVYWVHNEELSSLVSTLESEEEKKKIMSDRIELNKTNKNNDLIASVALHGRLTLKSVESKDESSPDIDVKVNILPAKANINENHINQAFWIVQQIIKARNIRKQLHSPEVTSEDILNEMKNSYPEILNKFLGNFRDLSFSWRAELENEKYKLESGVLNRYLIHLDDEDFIRTSKEIIFTKAKECSGNQELVLEEERKEENHTEDKKRIKEYFDELVKTATAMENINKRPGFQLEILIEDVNLILSHQETGNYIELNWHNNYSVFKFKDITELNTFSFKNEMNNLKISLFQVLNGAKIEKQLLRRSAINNFKNLIDVELNRREINGGQDISLYAKLAGFEVLFHQEALIMIERIFLLKIDELNTDFSEETIDKFYDLRKNTKKKIKTLINTYYSFLTLEVIIGYIGIILPLEPAKKEESDCWVSSLRDSKFSSNKELSNFNCTLYKSFEFVLNSMTSKYFRSLKAYDFYTQSDGQMLTNEEISTLIEESTVKLSIHAADELNSSRTETSDAKLIILISIPDIVTNLSPFLLEKLLLSIDCFTFLIERNMLKEIAFEKEKVLKRAQATFKIFSKGARNLSNVWNENHAIFSGSYLYIFSKQTDLRPIARIPIKKCDFDIDTTSFSNRKVAIIRHSDQEFLITLDEEKMFGSFVGMIEKIKNIKIARDLMEDLEAIEEEEKAQLSLKDLEKVNKILLTLKINVDSITLQIQDDSNYTNNKLILGKLDFEFTSRVLEKYLSANLESLTVTDFFSEMINEEANSFLISSQQTKVIKGKNKKLIEFKACIYEEANPFFQERLNRTEISLEFSSLTINFIPERFNYLINFFKKPIDQNIQKLAVLLEKYRDPTAISKRIGKLSKTKKIIKDIDGTFSAQSFQVILFAARTSEKVSAFKVQNFQTKFEVDSISTKIDGSVQNMQYLDFSTNQDPLIKNPAPFELIGVEKSKSIFKFFVEIRSDQCLAMTQSEVAIVLSLKSHSIRVNYMHLPFKRLYKYVKSAIKVFEGEKKSEKKQISNPLPSARLINPRFLSIDVQLQDTKIILKPMTTSDLSYELDISELKFSNNSERDKTRIKQQLTGLEHVYSDNLTIQTKSFSITKYTKNSRKQITDDFGFKANINKILWYNDYLATLGLTREQAIDIIDDSLKVDVSLFPVLIRITQEDCLDMRDIVLLNIKQAESKEKERVSKEEAYPEKTMVSLADPLEVKVSLSYIGIVFVDHTIQLPIAKLMIDGFNLKFQVDYWREQRCFAGLLNAAASYFELDKDTNMLNEKTFFGENFLSREIFYNYEDEKFGEIFDSDLLNGKEPKTLNVLDVEFTKSMDRDIEIIVKVRRTNLMIVIDKLKRLNDFFKIKDPRIVEQKVVVMRQQAVETSNTHIRFNLEDSEISIPADKKSYFIIRGNCYVDVLARNIDAGNHKDLEQVLKINTDLKNIEFLVFHDRIQKTIRNTLQKRSIIQPFSVGSHLVEFSAFDPSSKSFTSRFETEINIDQVNVRLAARDIVVIKKAINKFIDDYESYKNLPKFEEVSKLYEQWQKNNIEGQFKVDFLQHLFRVGHKGAEILCINDIGGNSLPIGEIVFYGTKGDQLIFEKNFEGITADNNFEATINYYNGNIGLWEPVLEPWKFKLRINIPEDSEREIVFKIYSEMASPLNLDYSDDFVILLLKTIQQWDSYLSSEFEEEKESPIKENYKMLTPGESISILSRKHEFEVEYISACTIINDTGYDIEVTPTEVENSKQFSTLKLEANERKDLLVEWAIEQASGGSKNLQNLKAAVKIHLREQKIDLFNFDIVNKGSRMQEFFMNDGRKGTVLCTVDFENEKKIVRFSSQYIVCNQLNEDIFIRILDKESLQTILIIPAFKEKSLPVDKIESSISFGHHAEIEDYPFYYELNRLIEQNETKIGGLYAYIRSEITKSFTQIIVEPLYSVRNCLPFTVSISLADKQKNIMEIVEGQTEIQVCQFPSINDVMMTLVTDNYMTNDYNLNTSDGKLYFGLGPYNLELEVAVMKKSESRTKRFIIFCTSCVLNLSGKELDFMNDVGVGLFEMAYSENLKIFLFNGLNRLRIKEKSEEFPHDKERGYIDIDAIGNYDHDIVDKKGKLTNLTLQVSNECCGIIFLYCNTLDTEYNFLTKIVRVYPKIVFINHTRHEIGIEQLQSLEVLSFPPETTRPLHFKVPATDKCMTIKILKTEGLIGMDNITWCRSGRLNALQPGDFQFSLENADKDQIRFFNLNVTPIQSTYYLTLQEQEPYETLIRIENCSDDLSLIVGTQEIPLGPKLKMPYAWVEPSKNEEIPIIVEYKNQRPTNLPKMMCLLKKVNCEVTQVLNYPDKTSLTVSYYVVLEGGARVLKFNYNALAANYKNPYSRKISVIFEIESVGVSIIGKPNNNKSELLYISVYKALGIIDYENERNSWHFQAQDLHIDNNMNENVLFPVLFSSINEDGLFFQLDVKFKNRKKKLEALHVFDIDLKVQESIMCIDSTTLNGLIELLRSIDRVSSQTVNFRNEIQDYIFMSPKLKESKNRKGFDYWGNKVIGYTSEFIFLEKIRISKIPLKVTFKMGNEDLPNGYFHSLVNTSLGRSIASFEDHRICVAELFHFCVYASWPAVVEMIKENYRREQDAMVKGILKAIKPLGKLLKMIIKKPDDIGYGKMRMHKTRTPRLFYGRERAYRIYNQEDLTVDQIIKAKENPKISTTPVDMIYVQSMDHGRLCFWLALKKISIVNLKKKQVFVEILLHNVKEPAIGDNSIILFFNKEVPNFGGSLEIRIEDYEVIMNLFAKITTLLELYKET